MGVIGGDGLTGLRLRACAICSTQTTTFPSAGSASHTLNGSGGLGTRPRSLPISFSPIGSPTGADTTPAAAGGSGGCSGCSGCSGSGDSGAGGSSRRRPCDRRTLRPAPISARRSRRLRPPERDPRSPSRAGDRTSATRNALAERKRPPRRSSGHRSGRGRRLDRRAGRRRRPSISPAGRGSAPRHGRPARTAPAGARGEPGCASARDRCLVTSSTGRTPSRAQSAWVSARRKPKMGRLAPGPHRRQTVGRGAAQHVEQDGLGLVIGGVTGSGTRRQGTEPL